MKRLLPLLLMLLFISGCTEQAEQGAAGSTDLPSEGVESTSGFTYTERDITVNPGDWQLPGTLTLPDGEGPFPAVVFVHGSGPIDRDGTTGKQKPLKDLATQLAEKGVASIRYDKRTYAHSVKTAVDKSFTVKDETIDDVLFAVQALMSEDKIDRDSIYIAGHSQGGYLVPRIDAQDSGNTVAGYIMLAGSVRSIPELLPVQIDYLLSLDDSLTNEDKETAKKQYADLADAINALTDTDKNSDKILSGAFPAYWLDLADYKPGEEVKKVSEPILVLQGGHDYQVTEIDFNLWKEALAGSDKAQFVLFPELTHTFVRTEKMSTPSDYYTYNEVDGAVSDAIYGFITGASAK